MVKLLNALGLVLKGIEQYHDTYTLTHELNVGKMMYVLAHAAGFSKNRCNDLQQAGSLHDIGKLALPTQILNKPAKLNAFEREVIETHPIMGANMLKKINHYQAKLAVKVILYHHEAYDGSGYPFGLTKDNIPIEARICSLCDVYDALRAQRPYHKNGPYSHDTVVQYILNPKDGILQKFDPQLIEIFTEIHEEFDALFCAGLSQ